MGNYYRIFGRAAKAMVLLCFSGGALKAQTAKWGWRCCLTVTRALLLTLLLSGLDNWSPGSNWHTKTTFWRGMLILLRAGLAAPEASECQPDVTMQLAKRPKQLLNSFFSFKMEVLFTSKQYALGIPGDYRAITEDGSFSPTCSPLMPNKRHSGYIRISKLKRHSGTGHAPQTGSSSPWHTVQAAFRGQTQRMSFPMAFWLQPSCSSSGRRKLSDMDINCATPLCIRARE